MIGVPIQIIGAVIVGASVEYVFGGTRKARSTKTPGQFIVDNIKKAVDDLYADIVEKDKTTEKLRMK